MAASVYGSDGYCGDTAQNGNSLHFCEECGRRKHAKSRYVPCMQLRAAKGPHAKIESQGQQEKRNVLGTVMQEIVAFQDGKCAGRWKNRDARKSVVGE